MMLVKELLELLNRIGEIHKEDDFENWTITVTEEFKWPDGQKEKIWDLSSNNGTSPYSKNITIELKQKP